MMRDENELVEGKSRLVEFLESERKRLVSTLWHADQSPEVWSCFVPGTQAAMEAKLAAVRACLRAFRAGRMPCVTILQMRAWSKRMHEHFEKKLDPA